MHGERGSLSAEAILTAAGLLLVASVLVAFGRVQLATGSVEAAAAESSRAASIARSAPAAAAQAKLAAVDSLGRQGLDCASISVQVDTAGFATSPGTPASVGATVSCTVGLSDLAIPGMPGQRTITTSASSPLDTYRERQ